MKSVTSILLIGVVAAIFVGGARSGPLGEGEGSRQNGFRTGFREQVLGHFQAILGASDRQWVKLKPLIEEVIKKQARVESDLGIAFLISHRSRADQCLDDEVGPLWDNAFPARTALQKALRGDASTQTVREQLKAYRTEVERRQAKLNKAQKQLREALSLIQEAKLVLAGLLD